MFSISFSDNDRTADAILLLVLLHTEGEYDAGYMIQDER